MSGLCVPCSAGVGLELLAVLLCILAVALFVWFGSRVSPRSAGRALFLLRTIAGPNSPFRATIGFYQVLRGFGSTVTVPWPPFFNQLTAIMGVVSMDFSGLPMGCWWDSSFYEELVLTCVAPIAAFAIAYLSLESVAKVEHLVAKIEHSRAVARHSQKMEEKSQRMEAHSQKVDRLAHMLSSLSMWISFLAFPSICSKVFSSFRCQDFDDGTSYLLADLSVDCQSPQRPFWVGLSVAFVCVWPLGLPALYTVLLYRQRKLLHLHDSISKAGGKNQLTRMVSSGSEKKLRMFAFLTKPYKPACWWYEIVECMRKMFLCGLILFCYPKSPAQIAIGIFVAVLALTALCHYHPWRNPRVQRIAVLLQVQTLMILVCAQMLQASAGDGADGSGPGEAALDFLLLVLSVSPIGVLFVAVALQAKQLRAELKGAPKSPPPPASPAPPKSATSRWVLGKKKSHMDDQQVSTSTTESAL